MAFDVNWEEGEPDDLEDASLGDDRIRDTRYGVRERAAVQHQAYADESGHSDVWEHTPGECTVSFVGTKANFPTPSTTTPGCIAIATDEANKPYYWNGTAWIAISLALLGAANTFAENQSFTKGIVANNTYIQGRNAAGSGNVDLIKANSSDKVQLPDAAQLATSAAPTADAQIANKKYVDDQRKYYSGNGTPSPLSSNIFTYGGEESITFPNGLIIKTGYIAESDASTPVTFAAAFPNGIVSVVVTPKRSAVTTINVVVTSVSTSGFTIKGGPGFDGYYWMAIGY